MPDRGIRLSESLCVVEAVWQVVSHPPNPSPEPRQPFVTTDDWREFLLRVVKPAFELEKAPAGDERKTHSVS